MANLELPLRSDVAHFEYAITLEGTTYRLEFMYNERAAGWFLTVRDEIGAVLLAGRRLVIGFPLVRPRFQDPRLPPGTFLALDLEGKGQEAGPDDLGNRVVLAYVESTA